jgi:hypothetical protein
MRRLAELGVLSGVAFEVWKHVLRTKGQRVVAATVAFESSPLRAGSSWEHSVLLD